ncbi:MAG: hypothetical protein JWM36_3859 [Hyphomicrobiales bacterium]|nr:hypothetical protein [Hyphomicrobiales bacterium]
MTIELAKLYVLLLMFVLHSAANGHAVLKLLRRADKRTKERTNRYSIWFFAISVGLVVNIAAVFGLGVAGLLNTLGVLAMGLALAVLSGAVLLNASMAAPPAHPRWGFQDAAVLAALFTVTFMASLHAPGHWDDTMYHLPLARTYVEYEGIITNQFIRFPLFPQNVNLLIALGIMMGGDIGAQAMASLPLFVIALGLVGASLWFTGSIVLGLLATGTLFVLAPVRETLGYAYIDNGLALFCWGAALALAVWIDSTQEQPSSEWLVVAGILGGGAAGSKYFGVVFAVLLAVYILVVRRDWKASIIYLTTAFSIGFWWYFRSFIISGDPIHPAGGNLFGYYLWDATDLLNQKREQASHGVLPSSLDIFGALKSAGAFPLALALGSLILSNLPLPLRGLRVVFIGYLIFWFFITQVDRYLAPIYAVGVLLAWCVVYQIDWLSPLKQYFTGRGHHVGGIVATLVINSTLGALLWDQYRRIEIAPTEWRSSLERRSGYRLFAQANGMIPQYGNRILHVGFENGVYFFHGTAIGDWFGPGRYRQMLVCAADGCGMVDPVRMKAIMGSFGAKMLAVSTARVPKFDREVYSRDFDIAAIDSDGLLMTVRD